MKLFFYDITYRMNQGRLSTLSDPLQRFPIVQNYMPCFGEWNKRNGVTFLTEKQVIQTAGHLNGHSITFQLDELTDRLVYLDLSLNSHLPLLLDTLFAQNLTFYMPTAWTFSLERLRFSNCWCWIDFSSYNSFSSKSRVRVAAKSIWKLVSFREDKCYL